MTKRLSASRITWPDSADGCQLLNWSAEAGKLGDEPRFHETWPINYAPDASKGASKWEAANKLYQKLECGKDATHSRVAGQVSYDDRWTELADMVE